MSSPISTVVRAAQAPWRSTRSSATACSIRAASADRPMCSQSMPADKMAAVGEDVAEKVVGHDDVEALGLGDEEHRGRVHVAVVHGYLGELLGQRVHGSLPQVPGVGEH